MTGGQALMKSLYLEGVRVIFGLPGVQLYHAMDALYEEPGIRFIKYPSRAGHRLYGRWLFPCRRRRGHRLGSAWSRFA